MLAPRESASVCQLKPSGKKPLRGRPGKQELFKSTVILGAISSILPRLDWPLISLSLLMLIRMTSVGMVSWEWLATSANGFLISPDFIRALALSEIILRINLVIISRVG